MAAAVIEIKIVAKAVRISRGCGFAWIIAQSAKPQAAENRSSAGATNNAGSIFVDLDCIFDEQVHSTSKSDHGSDDCAAIVPAVAFVEPVTDEITESDADRHLQSDAGHLAPIRVVVIGHLPTPGTSSCLLARSGR